MSKKALKAMQDLSMLDGYFLDRDTVNLFGKLLLEKRSSIDSILSSFYLYKRDLLSIGRTLNQIKREVKKHE